MTEIKIWYFFDVLLLFYVNCGPLWSVVVCCGSLWSVVVISHTVPALAARHMAVTQFEPLPTKFKLGLSFGLHLSPHTVSIVMDKMCMQIYSIFDVFAVFLIV